MRPRTRWMPSPISPMRFSFGEIRRRPRTESRPARMWRSATVRRCGSARCRRRWQLRTSARLRHHRLPGPRLLQPCQRALDPGGPGTSPGVSRDPTSARRSGDFDIKISGCINACGHHHVGHIGILGVDKNGEEFIKSPSAAVPTKVPELGTLLGPAVPYAQVADAVEEVVASYLELRQRPEETFLEAVKRLGVEPFRERVYAAH